MTLSLSKPPTVQTTLSKQRIPSMYALDSGKAAGNLDTYLFYFHHVSDIVRRGTEPGQKWPGQFLRTVWKARKGMTTVDCHENPAAAPPYLYLRENGTPYYVGKGSGKRAFDQHLFHVPPPRSRIVIQYWTDEEESFEMEKWYIRLFGRKDNGTGILRNLADGGAGGAAGRLCTQKTRDKLSAALTGRKLTQQHCRKIAEANIGKTLTHETREKISSVQKGKIIPKAARQNMSAAQKGRRHTQETREKLRKLQQGRRRSPETCRRISLAKKSNPRALEQCRRLGLASRGKQRLCRSVSALQLQLEFQQQGEGGTT